MTRITLDSVGIRLKPQLLARRFPSPLDGQAVHAHSVAYGALLLRAGLGAVFIAHALLKLFVYTLPGAAAFFAAHGFPAWTAYPVFVLELVGGALLIAGVYTRLVALALIPVLLGAFTVHWPNGWSFTAPNGGWEYVAFLIVALVVQALLGAGAFALHRPTGAHTRNARRREV